MKSFDLKRPNKLLTRICKALDINFIDVTEELSKSKSLPFFEIDEHLNALGHKLAAKQIAMQLSSRFKINKEGIVLTDISHASRYPQVDNENNLWYSSIKRDFSSVYYIKDSVNKCFSIRLNENNTHPFLSKDTNLMCFVSGNPEDFNTKVYVTSKYENNSYCITQGNNFGAIPALNNKGNLLIYAGWRYSKKVDDITGTKLDLYDLKSKKIIDSIGSGRDNIWRPIFINDNKIAYIKKLKNQYDIYTYEFKNKMEKQLTHSLEDEWDPIYNAKDSSFIFAKKTKSWNLYKLKNGNLKQLTFSIGDEWDPYIDNNGFLFYASKTGFFEVVQKYNYEF
jgi:hypothetical protein